MSQENLKKMIEAMEECHKSGLENEMIGQKKSLKSGLREVKN